MGKLTQYLPQNGIYVYFRQDKLKTVMVILSQNETEQTIPTKRFAENIGILKKGKNILTDTLISDLSNLVVSAGSIQVIELMN